MSGLLVALWPHLAALGLGLATMAIFAVRHARRPFTPNANINPTINVLIPKFFAYWFFWLLEAAMHGLLRLRLSPNQITILSTIVGLGAGVCYALGWIGAGGWLLIASGGLDMMDGWVARATGQTSRAGDFLDAMFDRYVELFIYLGVAVYYRACWWMIIACALATSGAMIISYARARGEIMGVNYNKGLFQRAERLVWLAVVSVFAPVAQLWIEPGAARPFYWPVAGLVILTAVMATLGGALRTIAIARLMARADAAGGPLPPHA